MHIFNITYELRLFIRRNANKQSGVKPTEIGNVEDGDLKH